MNFKLLFFVLLLGFMFVSCGDDDDEGETCNTSDITYTNTVAAIFSNNCAFSGCHATGTTTTFSLGSYDDAVIAAGFGRMIGALSHQAGFTPMPQGGSMLDQCTIDQVAAWINAGTPE